MTKQFCKKTSTLFLWRMIHLFQWSLRIWIAFIYYDLSKTRKCISFAFRSPFHTIRWPIKIREHNTREYGRWLWNLYFSSLNCTIAFMNIREGVLMNGHFCFRHIRLFLHYVLRTVKYCWSWFSFLKIVDEYWSTCMANNFGQDRLFCIFWRLLLGFKSSAESLLGSRE